MPQAKDNGIQAEQDLLKCWQNLEASILPESTEVARTLGLHILKMERRLTTIERAHIDPATGEPFDIKEGYAQILKLHAFQDRIEAQSGSMADQLSKGLFWIKGAVAVFGITGFGLLTLLVYIWNSQVSANDKRMKAFEDGQAIHAQRMLETTIVLERVQTVQSMMLQRIEKIDR